MNRGKLLILLMAAAGVSAGVLKVWNQHRHMEQVLASLTPSVARLIAEAPQAELLRVELSQPPDSISPSETVEIEGKTYRIADRRDLADAKGFAAIRDRLLDDASYDWTVHRIEVDASTWKYVLQFSNRAERARLAFGFPATEEGWLRSLKTDQTLVVTPIADGLATFFSAQFEEPAPPAK
ncbi:MAG: hypothetical protein IT427_05875 [Pirellulales bacterium]|nr:hypothetical protein [Pirellulales bacterium]